MSDLDKIRDDVEKYYAETEAKHYNLVKDLRDQPLFTLDTLFKFAAMYKYEQANGVTTGEKQCNLPDVVQ